MQGWIKSLPVQESGTSKCVNAFYADMCATSGNDYMSTMIYVKNFPLYYSGQVFSSCEKGIISLSPLGDIGNVMNGVKVSRGTHAM